MYFLFYSASAHKGIYNHYKKSPVGEVGKKKKDLDFSVSKLSYIWS